MDTQLKAITDSTRREILRRLAANEEVSAGAIASRFDVSRPAISHHLNVLLNAGLITVRREAQTRLYSIDAHAVARLRRWFDSYWDEALPRLKAAIEDEQGRRRRMRGETTDEGGDDG